MNEIKLTAIKKHVKIMSPKENEDNKVLSFYYSNDLIRVAYSKPIVRKFETLNKILRIVDASDYVFDKSALPRASKVKNLIIENEESCTMLDIMNAFENEVYVSIKEILSNGIDGVMFLDKNKHSIKFSLKKECDVDLILETITSVAYIAIEKYMDRLMSEKVKYIFSVKFLNSNNSDSYSSISVTVNDKKIRLLIVDKLNIIDPIVSRAIITRINYIKTILNRRFKGVSPFNLYLEVKPRHNMINRIKKAIYNGVTSEQCIN